MPIKPRLCVCKRALTSITCRVSEFEELQQEFAWQISSHWSFHEWIDIDEKSLRIEKCIEPFPCWLWLAWFYAFHEWFHFRSLRNIEYRILLYKYHRWMHDRQNHPFGVCSFCLIILPGKIEGTYIKKSRQTKYTCWLLWSTLFSVFYTHMRIFSCTCTRTVIVDDQPN